MLNITSLDVFLHLYLCTQFCDTSEPKPDILFWQTLQTKGYNYIFYVLHCDLWALFLSLYQPLVGHNNGITFLHFTWLWKKCISNVSNREAGKVLTKHIGKTTSGHLYFSSNSKQRLYNMNVSLSETHVALTASSPREDRIFLFSATFAARRSS